MKTPGDRAVDCPSTGLGRYRILVLSGSAALRRLARRKLAQAGFAVNLAPDDEAGWRKLFAGGYDLLITDSANPWGSDLEARLHKYHPDFSTPVLLLSGASVVAVVDPAPHPAPWFKAFLRRRFGRMRLLSAVMLILGRRSTTRPDSANQPTEAIPNESKSDRSGHRPRKLNNR